MKNDLTPKQVALCIAISGLNTAIAEQSFEQYVSNPAEVKLVDEQLKLLHKNLVEKSRLPLVTYLTAK